MSEEFSVKINWKLNLTGWLPSQRLLLGATSIPIERSAWLQVMCLNLREVLVSLWTPAGKSSLATKIYSLPEKIQQNRSAIKSSHVPISLLHISFWLPSALDFCFFLFWLRPSKMQCLKMARPEHPPTKGSCFQLWGWEKIYIYLHGSFCLTVQTQRARIYFFQSSHFPIILKKQIMLSHYSALNASILIHLT